VVRSPGWKSALVRVRGAPRAHGTPGKGMCHAIRGRTRFSPADACAASNSSLDTHSLTRPSPWMPLDAALQRREVALRAWGRGAGSSSAPREHGKSGRLGAFFAGDPRRGGGGPHARSRSRRARSNRARRGGEVRSARGGEVDRAGTYRPEERETRAGARSATGRWSVARVAILFFLGEREGARVRRRRRGSDERSRGRLRDSTTSSARVRMRAVRRARLWRPRHSTEEFSSGRSPP
jgi:hypothetical protein